MSMKQVAGLVLTLGLGVSAWAQDSVFLTNGNQLDGTIIQQNDQQVVLQLPYGTVAFDRSQIARIVDQPEAALTPLERGTAEATTRFPRWSTVVAEVAAQPWGGNLHQIPATVMAVGDLPYVPYLSFKCGTPGKGGTINVYGDLDNPIAFDSG